MYENMSNKSEYIPRENLYNLIKSYKPNTNYPGFIHIGHGTEGATFIFNSYSVVDRDIILKGTGSRDGGQELRLSKDESVVVYRDVMNGVKN